MPNETAAFFSESRSRMMNELLSKSWWMLALRGAVALLFGVLALVWPSVTLLWLVALFSAFAIVGGMVSIIGAVKNRKSDEEWWLILVLGIVSVTAGVIAIFHPALTMLVLVLVIGANALISGVLDIVVAVRLRKILRREWMLMLAGLVSILFGMLVFVFPQAGAVALVAMISFYAIVTGVLLLALAFYMRRRGRPAEASGDLSMGHS
jgi:uncharacterized membrane protein HdeD (DUF308 family)